VRQNVRQRFGTRLKELRTAQNWTQEDLADKAGIGRVFISQMENGHKDVCLGVLETLADSFKVTVSELMRDV
jgi:transcriptional regulator with XRE-family HTH domain